MEAAELVRLADDRQVRESFEQPDQQVSSRVAGQIRQQVQNGFVYGLDASHTALEQAKQEAIARSIQNVCFVEGVIESIPFASSSFDVIISNCVFNLSEQRKTALSEVYRVLKPGGQLVIADIISLQPVVSREAARLAALLFGCTNGVLTRDEYLSLANQTGFEKVHVELFLHFDIERIRRRAIAHSLPEVTASLEDPEFANTIHGLFASAYVSAQRPTDQL